MQSWLASDLERSTYLSSAEINDVSHHAKPTYFIFTGIDYFRKGIFKMYYLAILYTYTMYFHPIYPQYFLLLYLRTCCKHILL